ncbi:hypothetical protein ACFWI5_25110, partial [Streptomyces sp. NPDC127064]
HVAAGARGLAGPRPLGWWGSPPPHPPPPPPPPDQVNVASLLSDGRIGLYVVSQLARRHGINVRLQTNIYGGVQAVLVVPQVLLGSAPGAPAAAGATAGEAPREQGAAGAGAVQRPEAAGPAPAVPPAGAGPAPGTGTGRHRHAQPESAQHSGAGSGAETGRSEEDAHGGGGPAPLPVRGARPERPTPAEAVPGVSAQHRPIVEARAGLPPTPRTGPVRGTMGKPQLPRRRAQEHIVPQLRGGPAPRQDTDTVAGHDPGLMAAFQRGITLAEAQQHMEPAHGGMEPAPGESPYDTSGYLATPPTAPVRGELPRREPMHREPRAMGSAHTGSASMDAAHMGSAAMDAAHMGSAPMEPGHTASPYMGSAPMEPTSMAGFAHPDTTRRPSGPEHPAPAPIPPAHPHAPHGDGTRDTGRSAGSAPAG